MAEETKIATVEHEIDLEEYGSRQKVAVMGKRIKALLPGGENLTDNQAMALAQYSIVMDANPYRGEIYGWVDNKGQFHLTDGYKLLVRWAKRQCAYVEKYERFTEGLSSGDIGYRCLILRQDSRPFLSEMVRAGATFQEAFEIAATEGRGMIAKGEQHGYPPKGWTWEDVARKRALKNALNLAFGAPSPREIARESWIVDDVETQPEDWRDATPEMSQAEREAHAEWRARARITRDQSPEMPAETIIDELFDEPPPDYDEPEYIFPDNGEVIAPEHWRQLPIPHSWDELWGPDALYLKLGYQHKTHAQNALKPNRVSTPEEAWEFLISHQESKIADGETT